MVVSTIELSHGFSQFGDPDRLQSECSPEEVEKVVLVADYDSRVTPGERILEHGVSRVSVGTFLGLMVAEDRRDAFRDAAVIFEHETMRDAHMARGGRSTFSVEDLVTSWRLASLLKHLVPGASVVVCDKEHPVAEVVAYYPRVASGIDLAQFGLVPQG